MTHNKEEYAQIINKFSDLNILVLGDLMLDKYIQGSVSRISPEAPVPVIKVTKKENRIGGAGNVAANLASLNCKVTLASICGDDENGKIIENILLDNSIISELILSQSRPTTVKTRIIAQHQQVVRVDEEEAYAHSSDLQRKLIENINANSNKIDGIILSDYNKGLLTTNFIKQIISSFPSLPIIVDPIGHDYSKYSSATVIKPNWKEFKTATNNPELRINEIHGEAQKMVNFLKLQGIIVTLGEDGVFVLDNHGNQKQLPTVARDVFDVSGAGDTFIATFTAGLLASGDWLKAASLANIASGIVVGKVGTAVVHNHEILENLHLYE